MVYEGERGRAVTKEMVKNYPSFGELKIDL